MASLKELRSRITSVKNTQQITKTMKMVAAAKVRRARTACENARPYAEHLNKVLVNLAQGVGEYGPLLLTGREDVKKVRVIVFGSDRGLCGALNNNLFKQAMRRADIIKTEGRQVEFVTVGRKVRDLLRIAHKDAIVKEYVDVANDIGFELAEKIAQESTVDFEEGRCDQVMLLFARFENMLRQSPSEQMLLPFGASAAVAEAHGEDAGIIPAGVEYEPEETEILETLLPKNVSTQVFTAMLETAASEQAARMTAMDNATRNAGEMIKKLSLKYNRSRQAAITTELTEIISGAEAL